MRVGCYGYVIIKISRPVPIRYFTMCLVLPCRLFLLLPRVPAVCMRSRASFSWLRNDLPIHTPSRGRWTEGFIERGTTMRPRRYGAVPWYWLAFDSPVRASLRSPSRALPPMFPCDNQSSIARAVMARTGTRVASCAEHTGGCMRPRRHTDDPPGRAPPWRSPPALAPPSRGAVREGSPPGGSPQRLMDRGGSGSPAHSPRSAGTRSGWV